MEIIKPMGEKCFQGYEFEDCPFSMHNLSDSMKEFRKRYELQLMKSFFLKAKETNERLSRMSKVSSKKWDERFTDCSLRF